MPASHLMQGGVHPLRASKSEAVLTLPPARSGLFHPDVKSCISCPHTWRPSSPSRYPLGPEALHQSFTEHGHHMPPPTPLPTPLPMQASSATSMASMRRGCCLARACASWTSAVLWRRTGPSSRWTSGRWWSRCVVQGSGPRGCRRGGNRGEMQSGPTRAAVGFLAPCGGQGTQEGEGAGGETQRTGVP